MTSTSTPTKFVGNYESSTNHYDPDFTKEISTKMRVPDKISVIPGVELRESKIEKNQFNGDNLVQVKEKLNYMHVPERILVLGGNKHVAGREPYLDKGTDELHNFDDDIELKTPPNVLTLNDINSQENGHIKGFNESIIYPNEPNEDDLTRNDLFYNSFYNSTQNIGNPNQTDDTQIIRKQIKQLNRRVNALEHENRSRYNREIIFYAIGLIYLTCKSLYWFQRRF